MNTWSRVSQVIKKHPVATYYVITFLISWGGVVILLGGFSQISSEVLDVPFLPLYFVTVAGPSITGILLTGFYDGWKGCRELLSRLARWRVPMKWYMVAIVIAPVTVFASLFILTVFSPVFVPGIFSAGDNPIASMFGLPPGDTMQLLLFVVLLGIFNGFVEELGWTGFVTPRIRWRDHLIASGLNLGIMWGLWHFLSNYLSSAEGAGTVPLSLYLAVLLFSFLPPFRIIMGWVYAHTESLFIAILMHASLDIFWILSMPVKLAGPEQTIWYLVWAAVLWGVVGIIWKAKKQGTTVDTRLESFIFLPARKKEQLRQS